MPLKTGTLGIDDLIANKFQSVAEFGENTIAEVLQRDLANHNVIMRDMLAPLADTTTDRQRIQGTSQSGEMIEADEYSRGPTQKETPGQTVGFPIKRYQYAIGWTRDYMLTRTPADIATAQITVQSAQVRRTIFELKKALFSPTNYTHVDMLIDGISFPIKALVNADGAGIPNGPNGETFNGATHTHYLGSATLTTGAVDSALNTVVEHGHGTDVRIHISKGNEAAFRALTGFVAFPEPQLVPGGGATGFIPAPGTPSLDISRLDNRAIGRYNGATVWVKPWMIDNYLFVAAYGGAARPFAFRERTEAALRGLRIAGEIDTFPLRAQYMQVEFGIGVWNRTNGAVLQFNNATYTAPTITL